jgi:hypothetical protein
VDLLLLDEDVLELVDDDVDDLKSLRRSKKSTLQNLAVGWTG